MLKNTLLLLLLVAGAAFGGSMPDIVVACDGSGDFKSLQDAINSVQDNRDKRTVILVRKGLYDEEKLIVPASKQNITLLGEGWKKTIIRYGIHDCGCDEAINGKCPPELVKLWEGENIRTSATLTILANGFHAENLSIENSAGPVGQAQAITVRSDKVVFLNCKLASYQDTIYFWGAGRRSYFKDCLVIGRTDYIYGDGIAFFDECEIRSWGGGWITAPSTPKEQKYGFIFNKCEITYDSGSPRKGDDGHPFRLGRPWHNYPKVAWINCEMDRLVHPEGWGDTWRMDYAATSADLHLYEYGNKGRGADMDDRADWAGLRELKKSEAKEYTVDKVLSGEDGWDPSDD